MAEVLPHYAAQVLEDRRQEDQPHERIGGKEREQQHTGIAGTVLLFGQADVPIGMGVEQRPGIRRREIEPEIRPPPAARRGVRFNETYPEGTQQQRPH